jgi:beta-lactamase superfamily II metal-dependent hydrolase
VQAEAAAGSTLARRGTAARPSPAGPPRAPRTGPFFDITMLPAGHGDALWIEYGDGDRDTHRFLIDCGTQQTAKELLRCVAGLPEREKFLELFILSHIDSDHIGGALPFFKAVRDGLRIGDLWFNGWRHLSGQLGARQGEMFSTAIQDFELPWNAWLDGEAVVVRDGSLPTCALPGGMQLTLLSPTPAELRKLTPVWTRELKRYGLTPGTRVDYGRFLKGKPSTSEDVDALADTPFGGDNGAPNGTSIGVLAEYRGASALLTADAHAPVVAASIRTLLQARGRERLKIDVFKVSHHASQNNVSTELVSLLDCPHFLVSTNGDHFCHPDRQAIARIIKYGKSNGRKPELHFNYRSQYNELWARQDLQEKYGFTTGYPDTPQLGHTVSLLP